MTGDLWTAPGEAARRLSAMTEDERYHYFDQLQSRMVGVWEVMRLNYDDESVVVVPSLTLDRTETTGTGTMMQAYEERFLFLLILLREPRLRMVYVTSHADRARDRRVLPGAAARGDPEPRARPAVADRGQRRHADLAQREAAGPAAAAPADRGT